MEECGFMRNQSLRHEPDKEIFSFDWVIEDFFVRRVESLPQSRSLFQLYNHCLVSPSFPLHHAKWSVRLFPEGSINFPTYIGVFLNRTDSLIESPHSVQSCTITMSIYCGDTKLANSSLRNAGFYGKNLQHGFPNLVEKSKLFQMETEEQRVKIVVQMELRKSNVCLLQKPPEPLKFELETLTNNLRAVYLNQKNCDVTFTLNGKEFPAHRVILGARSPYFANMFQEHKHEKNAKYEIPVADADFAMFQDVLVYLYSGELPRLSLKNIFQYFEFSVKYKLTELKVACLNFMESNMSESTLYDFLPLADKHNERDLKMCATDFIVNNADRIFKTGRWEIFKKAHQILSMEMMEVVIFKKIKSKN